MRLWAPSGGTFASPRSSIRFQNSKKLAPQIDPAFKIRRIWTEDRDNNEGKTENKKRGCLNFDWNFWEGVNFYWLFFSRRLVEEIAFTFYLFIYLYFLDKIFSSFLPHIFKLYGVFKINKLNTNVIKRKIH